MRPLLCVLIGLCAGAVPAAADPSFVPPSKARPTTLHPSSTGNTVARTMPGPRFVVDAGCASTW
jgi:hypothetical protein